MRRILVVSPHPDDEIIGCGGTLRHHVVSGETVRVIFLTSGEQGGHGIASGDAKKIREGEAQTAAEIIGYRDLDFWHQPDGLLQATPGLSDKLCVVIQAWRPDIIYVPHLAEYHRDHGAAAMLVRRSMQRLKGHVERPKILAFEVWTPLQQVDEAVDISPYLECKRLAMQAYKSQNEVIRFEEAFVGLNRYRGELHNSSGGDYAEVFARLSE